MGFFVYDISFLVIFTLAIAAFIIYERKKIVREGPLFLYKTSIGLKFMDRISKKYPKTLRFLSYVIIICGFLLMIASIYLLLQLLYMFLKPEFVKAVKIPPIMPLIPYLPEMFNATWLPPFYFTYWIIAIALVAICHEGAHGIFARFYNIRIKSSGFGFLGPFLAFFVEQDDKQMKKAKPFRQMAVLAAGVFANLILAVVFFFLLIWFFSAFYAPAGAVFQDYIYSAAPATAALDNFQLAGENITLDGVNLAKIELAGNNYFVSDAFFSLNKSGLDNNTFVKLYWDTSALRQGLRGAIVEIDGREIDITENISQALADKNPGDSISVVTKYKNGSRMLNLSYELILAEDYGNESRAVIGIASINASSASSTGGFKGFVYKLLNYFRDANTYYEPKLKYEATEFFYNLILWLFLINFGVALANMWPVAIFDGGYFFYSLMLLITKNRKLSEKSLKWATKIFLAILALMMILWAKGLFFS